MKKIFPFILALVGVVQMLTDTMNSFGLDSKTQSILGGILILLSITLSSFKQYFDPATSNKSLYLSLVLFLAGVTGGLLEHFNVFSILGFEEKVLPPLRLVLTILTMYLSSITPLLFPSSTNPNNAPNR